MSDKTHQPEASNIHHLDQIERGLNQFKNSSNNITEKDYEITSNNAISYKNLPREENEKKKTKPSSLCRWVVALVSLFGNIISVVVILRKNSIHPAFPRSNNKNPSNQLYYVSQAQLLEHNTPSDCWMAMHGKVYDLTNYAKKHPGRDSIITDRCGSDATTAYDTFHGEPLLLSINNDLIGNMLDVVSEEDKVFSAVDETYIPRTTRKSSGKKNINSIDFFVNKKSNRVISMVELSNHNTAEHCWVAIHDEVYDLTNYASEHPGGSMFITNLAGTDGTDVFSGFHPVSFLPIIDGYRIGTFSNGDIVSTSRDIAMAELSNHNTAEDCWVALHDKVYDLTNYVSEHPGGSTFITSLAGTDGTDAFDAFHPVSFLPIIDGYKIGTFREVATPIKTSPPTLPPTSPPTYPPTTPPTYPPTYPLTSNLVSIANSQTLSTLSPTSPPATPPTYPPTSQLTSDLVSIANSQTLSTLPPTSPPASQTTSPPTSPIISSATTPAQISFSNINAGSIVGFQTVPTPVMTTSPTTYAATAFTQNVSGNTLSSSVASVIEPINTPIDGFTYNSGSNSDSDSGSED